MRSAMLLLLALVAAGTATLVAIRFDDFQLLCGLAIAQVQLAAAATVLLRRRLAWSLAALLAGLFFWANVLTRRHDVETFALNLLLLLSVTLFTAAWCGLLAFGGWRLVVLHKAQSSSTSPYQFSLATLLLITCIACVYGGLWQWLDYSYYEYSVAMLFLLCSLAGCTVLKISSRGTWPWLPVVTIPAVVIVATNLPIHRFLLYPEWMLPVLATQSIFLVVTLSALRVAGCYLQRSTTLPIRTELAFTSTAATTDSRWASGQQA